MATPPRVGDWNHVWDKRKGKWVKAPHSATTGRMEKGTLNAPGFLGTFDQALATMRKRGLAGIGISLEHAKLTGADLDDCISDSGSLTPLAAEVLGYGRDLRRAAARAARGLHFLAHGAAGRCHQAR